MRRPLVVLLVLAATLAVVDRAAVLVVERVLADQAQSEAGLGGRPDVDVAGFPFLTQALAGQYDEVRLQTSGSVAGEVSVERLDVRLSGVRVPLDAAIRGQVSSVPVEGLDADVVIGYDELARQSGRDITLAPRGDQVRVSGKAAGVEAAATSEVRLESNRIVVRAQSFEVGNETADRALNAVLGDRFDFSVRVGALPYGLELTDIEVQEDGVHLTAEAGATVLSR